MQKGAYVVLIISDTGPGIPDKDIDRFAQIGEAVMQALQA